MVPQSSTRSFWGVQVCIKIPHLFFATDLKFGIDKDYNCTQEKIFDFAIFRVPQSLS